MRYTVSFLALLLTAALLTGFAAAAQPEPDPQTAMRLRALEGAIDELNRDTVDTLPEVRSRRGASLNHAFVALTGEAINPLFGITALGMYNYFRTDESLRHLLPVYDRPEVWVPLLIIILLMLFNSTLCEALPFLKVPLNALGDIVNKAGAVAVLPLVVKMFADAVAHPTGVHIAMAADFLFPAAQAAEAGAAGGVWPYVGWAAGAVAGTVIYLAVWLTFNVVDVLILICPFPGVDAMLKGLRLSVIAALYGLQEVSPTLAALAALLVVVPSFFVAGWSFRLSLFGLVFSTDILFFRRRDIRPDGVTAFVSDGLCRRHRLPMRTLGRLELSEGGGLAFSYRPWLIRSRRTVALGDAGAFAAGRGLLTPFVVDPAEPNMPLLRLAPGYRGRETALAETFRLNGVVDCGIAGSLRGWLAAQFGAKCETA